MTVRNIELYPSCDIHLLLEGPTAPTRYQLEVRDFQRTQDNLSALVARTAYSDMDPAIATVSPTGEITPIAVGETFCRVRHTDTDPPPSNQVFVSEVVVRIRVHRKLEQIWFGNNRASIFQDESAYVLSVFGLFDDGSIGDLSSHPFLNFHSNDPAKVEVNNTDDRGRLTGRSVTASAAVRIRVAFNTLADEIEVSVAPPVATAKRILERIHGAGPAAERRNILFLADGFSAVQKPLFRKLVTLMKDELFTSRLHSPYDLLKDRFNVWLAFDASAEEGASAGEPVAKIATGFLGVDIALPLSTIDRSPADSTNYSLRDLVLRVGLPDRYHPMPTNRAQAEAAWAATVALTDFNPASVEDTVMDAWLTLLAEYSLLQTRDTLFGIMNGTRYGDQDSTRVDPAAAASKLMHWYQPPYVPRAFAIDRRRMPRSWNPLDCRDRYLASLRPVGGNDPVGQIWMSGGADSSLVVVLVNSAYGGGVRSASGLQMSTRENWAYTQVHRSGRRADHSLPDLEVLSTSVILGGNLDDLASTLAHEMAHAFSLGDEYEGSDFPHTHDALDRADAAGRRTIESYENLVHHYAIEKPAGGHGIIDVEKVKWRHWHRIARCSILTENAASLGGGRLQIRVRRQDRAKWDRDDMHNANVFLRTRNINVDLANQQAPAPPAPAPRWRLEGPLKILEFQADGSMVLASTDFTDFRAGDVLYEAEVADGKALTVFHPNVLFDLKTIEEPFAMKTDPRKPSMNPAYPPQHALVPDFKPRHPAYVVGVYEGGGTYNTRVYRPAGSCKMRTVRASLVEKAIQIDEQGNIIVQPARVVRRISPFCHVCRYSIVNTLDPVALEGLDYPQ